MLGSFSVNKKVFEKVKFCNKLLGFRASPDDAYLVLRYENTGHKDKKT